MSNPSLNKIPSSKKQLYNRIAEQGVVSKAELLAAFSLTSSSLTRLLDEMVAEKLLIMSGLGPSNGGRRPILYEINPDYGYFFGLEISRRYSSLGFFDMKMNPKSLIRWRMDEAMTPHQFVEYVSNNIRSILLDHNIDRSRVIGIGVGAVGPLDREKGIILQPLNFPASGWNNVSICSILQEETGIPAQLENGANAALLGEQWAMRSENLQHMLYVHAGVGLRSAMMSYGQIVHGSIDMEGSIGQMIIQMDGPRLHDHGNYGALEAFVSVQALESKARSHAKLGRTDMLNIGQTSPEKINYDMLLHAFSQDNPYARELFMQSAVYFGIGLANLINVFHPQKIILGGVLVNSSEQFYQTAIEIAQKNSYYFPNHQPSFSKGELKEEAVVTGSALMIWRGMEI
ncbi:putative NBD/HSP70 family sugar kinase [Paenibacillus castaneae]|uniref:ROK family protein n=1 Tax=Paenibacillus castaneae TaxID=474957 RepID=UPI000C9A77A0|nr:ROK family protein [Paenibacillus castaneae]NIK75098.1 putative NBD/HSP70 family sugar kinase [Paenibacillus castaneae]